MNLKNALIILTLLNIQNIECSEKTISAFGSPCSSPELAVSPKSANTLRSAFGSPTLSELTSPQQASIAGAASENGTIKSTQTKQKSASETPSSALAPALGAATIASAAALVAANKGALPKPTESQYSIVISDDYIPKLGQGVRQKLSSQRYSMEISDYDLPEHHKGNNLTYIQLSSPKLKCLDNPAQQCSFAFRSICTNLNEQQTGCAFEIVRAYAREFRCHKIFCNKCLFVRQAEFRQLEQEDFDIKVSFVHAGTL